MVVIFKDGCPIKSINRFDSSFGVMKLKLFGTQATEVGVQFI